MANIVMTLLQNHKSVRKFKDIQVDRELLNELIICGQHASTSQFVQAYTILNITDMKIRRAIYDEVTSQQTFMDSPVFLMFCADVNRLLRACDMNEKPAPKEYIEYTETFLVASMDAAIVAQNVVVAAEANGLGCTYIGGIRNDLSKMIELLELPHGVYPLFGLAIGYPLENTDEMAKPRLPLDVVFKENKYGVVNDEELIKEYDKVIAEYYRERTSGERVETWTEQMAGLLQKPQRPSLKNAIQGQGYVLK